MENHKPHEADHINDDSLENKGVEETGLPQRLSDDLKAYHQFKNTDTNLALSGMRLKTKTRKLGLIALRLLPYASILVVVLAILWHMQQKPTVENTAQTTEQYNPAASEWNNKAMLVLSDGSMLSLDQDANTQLREEGGVRIQNNAGGILAYHEGEETQATGSTNKLLIPAGARYQLRLSDGTEVWLNAATELEYPVQFSSAERRVKLKGEAFFQVRSDASRPFIVELENGSVIATGTTFNISSYATDAFMETTLVSGKISVKSSNGHSLGMIPGDQFRLNRADQTYVLQQVDTRFYTSWKEGVLLFNSVSLAELAQKLERWYDVKISFSSEKTAALRFSGAMENSRKLEFLLGLIAESSGISYEVQSKTIVIK